MQQNGNGARRGGARAMTPIVTSSEMRRAEAAAMESGRVTGARLMEAAGRATCAAILDHWPDLARAPARVAILAGPGNNGGDGFVIARLLRARGWDVSIRTINDRGAWSGDAHAMRARAGGDLPLNPGQIADLAPDLVVDALFGTGLTRPVELPLTQADLAAIKAARRVAVDGPSGLCLDSGRGIGQVLAADLTVSFGWAKRGHYLADGPKYCGQLVLAPIGLRPGDLCAAASLDTGPVQLITPRREAARDFFLKNGAGRGPGGHKFSFGHAVCFAGGVGRGGAGRLAARAALRIGAGLTTVFCPPAALQENAARLDAVMLRPVTDAAEIAVALEDRRITGICIGPGHGGGARTREAVAAVLAAGLAAERGAVLDADALTAFAEAPDALWQATHSKTLLTPHDGEFARLFPDLADRLSQRPEKGPAFSRIDAARAAAARAGCCVLLKGPDTVIAAPDGAVFLHAAAYDRAAPELATAGSGDVLAGFATGLLARGHGPVEAACWAAWIHTECARAFGPGLIAEDIPEMVPSVLRALRDAGKETGY